jgi:hypothetical protein
VPGSGPVVCQPSFSGIGLTGGNGLAAADDASSCIEKHHRAAASSSFIGSDRAQPDTATSAHHADEP